MASYKIENYDAEVFLDKYIGLPSVITSLPDHDEVDMSIDYWRGWFVAMVYKIIANLADNEYAIFYQTDRKYKGELIDKSYLCNVAAREVGAKSIFHKIVLKQEPDTINLFRPSYTHLLCYSKHNKSGKAQPDVIYAGKMLYKNAMGFNACKLALNFLKMKGINKVVDPFCGQGSVVKIAYDLGFDVVGNDIDKEQCIKALNNLRQEKLIK